MPTSIRKSRLPVSRREVFQTVEWQVQARAGTWRPPTDAYETENEYVVRVEISGMHEDDFKIIVEDRFLMISGNRPDIPERRAYHQMEIRFGKFETIIGLPGPVDLETSRAEYSEGFLNVTLPKAIPNKVKIENEN